MRNASTNSLCKIGILLCGFVLANAFEGMAQHQGDYVKCALPLLLESMSVDDGTSRDEVPLLSQPSRLLAKELTNSTFESNALQDLTYRSPSGKFVLHYVTSGKDAVDATDINVNGIPDYIERAAESADSSYAMMVDQLGYPDPIPVGSTYDIFFRDFNFYGYTIENGTGTEIFIHSTFQGFPENDYPGGDILGALYVTIAHEFKHAIQYQTNRWRGEAGSFDWIEMDATMMEEVVYDEVNDYYNYLGRSSIFETPHEATPGAYSHVTWSLYFSERFGPEFWVETWNQFLTFPNMPFVEAVTKQLELKETTFEEEHLRNHLWHMTSGQQFSDTGFGFDERANYPNSTIYQQLSLIPDSVVFSSGLSRNAARYLVVNPSSLQEDVAEITIKGATPGLGAALVVWFRNGEVRERMIQPSLTENSQTIRTGWPWRDIERLGIVISGFSSTVASPVVVFSSYQPEALSLNQNYPNPFNPSTTIRFELAAREQVQLEVFDVTGRRVAEVLKETLSAGEHRVEFNATGLASGVYYYRLSTPTLSSTRSMILLK